MGPRNFWGLWGRLPLWLRWLNGVGLFARCFALGLENRATMGRATVGATISY